MPFYGEDRDEEKATDRAIAAGLLRPGQGELTSAYAKSAIEMLVSVHALACMTRGSGNVEHLRAAAGWLPQIEDRLRAIRADIEALTKLSG